VSQLRGARCDVGPSCFHAKPFRALWLITQEATRLYVRCTGSSHTDGSLQTGLGIGPAELPTTALASTLVAGAFGIRRRRHKPRKAKKVKIREMPAVSAMKAMPTSGSLTVTTITPYVMHPAKQSQPDCRFREQSRLARNQLTSHDENHTATDQMVHAGRRKHALCDGDKTGLHLDPAARLETFQAGSNKEHAGVDGEKEAEEGGRDGKEVGDSVGMWNRAWIRACQLGRDVSHTMPYPESEAN
jgi:hypothetical protein